MPRRDFRKFLLLSLLAGTVFSAGAPSIGFGKDGTVKVSSSATSKPNIVIILADDLGYGSTTPYGAPESLVKTPNIDRIAKEGKRFTQAYTGSSVCSPTRYGLITGQYAFRTSLQRGVLNPFAPLHIRTDQLTVASLLDKQGYNTAAIGKWHLGYGNARSLDGRTDYKAKLAPGPLEIGFDYHFGIPSNHGDITGVFVENHYTYGLKNGAIGEGDVVASPAENDDRFQKDYGKENTPANRLDGIEIDAPRRKNDQVPNVLTEKAVQWIEKQSKDQPFFLYYTPVGIHNPLTPSPEVAGSSAAGVYGDWIHELDRSVGALLEALDRTNATENTLLVFTSDNGGVYRPDNKSSPQTQAYEKGLKVNGSLRGGKHTIYEGGFRVPYIVRWPGKVQPGSTSDEIVSLVDTVASLAAVTGQTLPPVAEAAQDSYDISSAWTSDTSNSNIRRDVIVHSAEGVFAIRKGDWKWVEGVAAPTPNGLPNSNRNQTERLAEQKPQLFHLAKDPSESKDVSSEHPEVVKELQDLLVRYRAGGFSRELPEESVVKIAAGIPAISEPVEKVPSDPWRIVRGKWEPKEGGLFVTVQGNQTAALAVAPELRNKNAAKDAGSGATNSALTIKYDVQLLDAERATVRIDANNNRSYRFDVNESGIQIVKNDSDGRDGPDQTETWGTAGGSVAAGKWYTAQITIDGTKASFVLQGESIDLTLEAEQSLIGEKQELTTWVIAGGTAGIRNVTVE